MVGIISASVGAICLIAAGLIWTIGRRHTPRLVVALVVTGAVGLAGTTVGQWLHLAAGWVSRATGWLGAATGVVVPSVLGAVLAVYVGYHMYHRTIETKTLAAAAALPFTATTVTGVFGSLLVSVLSILATVMAWPITALFGIH